MRGLKLFRRCHRHDAENSLISLNSLSLQLARIFIVVCWEWNPRKPPLEPYINICAIIIFHFPYKQNKKTFSFHWQKVHSAYRRFELRTTPRRERAHEMISEEEVKNAQPN